MRCYKKAVHRLNLLRHKRTVRRHWELKLRRPRWLPEIIMEGEHAIHTDEDGNILLDKNSDQWVHEKEKWFHEFNELFDALESDPDGKGRELAEEILRDEAVMIERFTNTIGPIVGQYEKPTDCSSARSLKLKIEIGDMTD